MSTNIQIEGKMKYLVSFTYPCYFHEKKWQREFVQHSQCDGKTRYGREPRKEEINNDD